MTGFDHERVSRAVGSALSGPGGVALVVKVFSGVPGVAFSDRTRSGSRSATGGTNSPPTVA
jgi:hypothetical protein